MPSSTTSGNRSRAWRYASALGALALALPATAGAARPAGPKIRAIDCWPRHCTGLRVAPRAWLRIDADRLGAKSYVQFPTGNRRTRWVRGKRRSARRLLVQVPANAVTGRLRLWFRGRPVSRASRRVTIVRTAAKPRPVSGPAAFAGQGMWIWQLPRSEGGSVPAIVARARAAQVSTLFIKGADGTNVWSQFSPSLVASLRAAGLHVCTWQYTYGSSPAAEAVAAATAISRGAECFVIDAEAEYEGHYAQAQQYVQALRARVGAAYPIALSSFPYVDYHPGFPYSVFLGPGGAQADLPQMYWKAIGTSVDQVFAHTWALNRVYGAPIYPVGQTYQSPSAAELTRFRALTPAYGAAGLSWWDWQETSQTGWAALAAPVAQPPRPAAADAWPTLAQGSGGDLVVWAQEHLNGAGSSVTVDGSFGPATRQAVVHFQAGAGLSQTGRIDAATWPALLRSPAVRARWAASGRAAAASVRQPRSARLRAVRDEVPALGRGG
jgi:Putative peptidoglycan binding domain